MGEGKRGMKVVWEGWQGGEKQDDEGKGGGEQKETEDEIVEGRLKDGAREDFDWT